LDFQRGELIAWGCGFAALGIRAITHELLILQSGNPCSGNVVDTLTCALRAAFSPLPRLAAVSEHGVPDRDAFEGQPLEKRRQTAEEPDEADQEPHHQRVQKDRGPAGEAEEEEDPGGAWDRVRVVRRVAAVASRGDRAADQGGEQEVRLPGGHEGDLLTCGLRLTRPIGKGNLSPP
jgi:hypothetical protein